ncbi:MAG: hypothetical protein JAY90_19045 [Candidatus Thiodiazotropha lotti]|nr:hypothetical protein [Candidatus Thiodiazotropha lotti]
MGFLSSVGGMVGGVVGGMFGGPIGAQIGSQVGAGLGGMLENLIGQHGQPNVQSAMNNNMMGSLTSQLGQAIQCHPDIPQFAKDEMCQALDSVRQNCPAEPTPPGCQQDTDDSMSGLIDKIVNKVVDQIMEKLQAGGCESGGSLQDMVRQAIEDVVREQIGGGAEDGGCAANGGAASTGGQSTFDRIKDMAMDEVKENANKEEKASCEEGGGSKKGGDNWLVALAKAMSSIQSQHLNKMLDAQKEMQDNVGEDEASRENFIEAQSRFQAESKLFSMASEATSTALKSIGDGLSSIARKQ